MLLRLLIFLQAVVHAIYLGWPMDEQLPNVARVNQTYDFTIANLTYRSNSGGSISYSVSGLPTWLSFDDDSRTFSGTPSEDDVGTFNITLTGSDSADGSELSKLYEMLVSSNTGFELSSLTSISSLVAKYGRTNGKGGLVLSEGEDFNITLSADLFEAKSGNLRPIIAYYGRSDDRTSLPSWISFNSDTLTFSGTAPYVTSSIAPSSEYGFSFIASDYYGFAGVEAVFEILVGAHELSTSIDETIKINGTYELDFDIDVPILSSVYLDGSLINKSNISSVVADDLPSYITFDASNYTLSGVFPNKLREDNFSIVVYDYYGNDVTLPYEFYSIGSVFTVDLLSDVNATRGEFFEYQIMHSLFTDYNDTTVSVSLENNTDSWLTYEESNMTLLGQAPSNLKSVSVKIEAESDFDSESREFSIVGVAKTTKTTTSSSSSALATSTSSSSLSSSSSSSSAASTSQKSLSGGSNKRALILGLAIGIPCFVLLVALLLIFFICCRKRRNNDEEENDKSMEDTIIDGPGIGVTHNMDDHAETAHQLNALNALKLDNDAASTLSSVTHVDTDSSSNYYDASEKPMKSWRAKDESDLIAVKNRLLQQRHASEISNSTVNTEELFAVRLVDDEARNSAPSSPKNAFFLRDSLDQIIGGSSSSPNIQRLDSDGNIASEPNSTTSSPRKQAAQRMSLTNIAEESRLQANNAFYNRENNESSNYDLMSKYFNDASSIASGEERAAENPDNYPWQRSRDALIASPDSETFLLNNLEQTPVNTNAAATDVFAKNISSTSVYSEGVHENFPYGSANANDSQAKLVEFTRKGSLRDSSHTPNMEFSGETAQIHDGDSGSGESSE